MSGGVNLMRHAKKSTNRDFRMTFKEVPEPEPEPEEEEAQEEYAAQEAVWQQMSNDALVADCICSLAELCWKHSGGSHVFMLL